MYNLSLIVWCTVDFDQMLDQKAVTSNRKIAEETAYSWLKVYLHT